MTADDFVSHLDGVRPTARGWTARCPAHDDQHPSLSVTERECRILLKCWAGCDVREIVGALGLGLQDLFADAGTRPHRPARPTRSAPRLTWRRQAARLEDHAIALSSRTQSVLAAARGLDCSGWTAGELDAALGAVSRAYEDTKLVTLLEEAAFGLRCRGLKRETQRRRHAA